MGFKMESNSRAPNTPRLLTIPDAKSLLTPGTLTQFAPSSKGAEQGLVSSESDPLSVRPVRAFKKSGKVIIRYIVVEVPSSHLVWWRDADLVFLNEVSEFAFISCLSVRYYQYHLVHVVLDAPKQIQL